LIQSQKLDVEQCSGGVCKTDLSANGPATVRGDEAAAVSATVTGMAAQLICAECGSESPPDAAGWRAYLDDDGQAVTFCRTAPSERLEGDVGVRLAGIALKPFTSALCTRRWPAVKE
jgi:hypothetical protein